MKKKIILSVIKLIMMGFLAKLISTFAKIIIAQKIGIESMSIYSLTVPTMVLMINIAQAGFPTAIAKLIAQNRDKTFKIMISATFLSLLLNIIIACIYFPLVPVIGKNLLHNSLTYPTLYCIGCIVPLVSFSGLLKGYFVGIEEVEKSSYCQISEEIARILFIVVFIDLFSHQSPSFLAFFAMCGMLIGEIASIIHMLCSMHIKWKKKIHELKQIEKKETKQWNKMILSISLPTTSTRIIGSISYFFEPILFTFLMLQCGVSAAQTTIEYGIITGYIMPLLLLPGFFASAFSLALLPRMSKAIAQKNYSYAKKLLFYFVMASFVVGLIFSLTIFLAPKFFMNLLYHHTQGYEFIKKYALFIIVYYIEAPLGTAMVALSLEKHIFIDSLICNLAKIIAYFIFIPLFQTDGLVIGLLIGVYCTVFINIYFIQKKFRLLLKQN